MNLLLHFRPVEVRPAQRYEQQRGPPHRDLVVGLQLAVGQQRRVVQMHEVRPLEIRHELVLPLAPVIDEEGLLLAGDRIVAEIDRNALARRASDGVRAAVDRSEVALARPVEDDQPADHWIAPHVGLDANRPQDAGVP